MHEISNNLSFFMVISKFPIKNWRNVFTVCLSLSGINKTT